MTVQQSQNARFRPFRSVPFGRYTLLSPLSVGAMGEIFLARFEGAEGSDGLCVIKKLLPQLAHHPEFVERFVNEARILEKLSHRSITQVLDVGLHEGEPYIALEFVDGRDLRQIAARARDRALRLPVTFVLYVMSRVLDALAYAHRKRDDDEQELGLVHRDVSPHNILISFEGEVKVIDFGLARSTLSAVNTDPRFVLGKFLYMSPEQTRHPKVDHRSDLYSAGLCLYELLSGRHPFHGVPGNELMELVANPVIAPIHTVDPRCPPAVQELIARALEVDPARRFQTAEEFRQRVEACLLELDPSAGPETVTRYMRDAFAAEYAEDRRLLASLRLVARLDPEADEATAEKGTDRKAEQLPLRIAAPSAQAATGSTSSLAQEVVTAPSPTADTRAQDLPRGYPRALQPLLPLMMLMFATAMLVAGWLAWRSTPRTQPERSVVQSEAMKALEREWSDAQQTYRLLSLSYTCEAPEMQMLCSRHDLLEEEISSLDEDADRVAEVRTEVRRLSGDLRALAGKGR